MRHRWCVVMGLPRLPARSPAFAALTFMDGPWWRVQTVCLLVDGALPGCLPCCPTLLLACLTCSNQLALCPFRDPLQDTAEIIHISSVALIKMLKHGRAGVPLEVMGLMLGEFVDEYTVKVSWPHHPLLPVAAAGQ